MATELQEQLQDALGDSYTLERELGGGGMSRVFIAREVGLGRSVVVKVLPAETAASVSIERFRREIQVAASLQHPHIVPVHAAGQAGEFFYYTMPLVEGESLRARLAREGTLPVRDTLRILLDVTDALAYAHAHGVVHRDIKPDNILISGHHALVTDFGVAKAVSASTSSSSLTSMGVALGTPAYMAPEQAVADPAVDHRADIYAVGVLAYEMLCGRPPFTGMAPQQVLAAHVTQTPEPLIARQPDVPPAISAFVMRCLEKKASDRVQSAEELHAQLLAMTTPGTSSVMMSGPTAPLTAEMVAALRRGHPARVIAVFGATSLAVLAAAYAIMIRLGLPDWVFRAAIALLVVGLPILLATGLAERERLLARAAGADIPPPRGVQRLLTWRGAVLGGVLAFLGLALASGSYAAMRAFGIGPAGTLVSSGTLAARQPVILADFENRSADSTLGPTLTEAFRVDLSQSPTVRLLDAQAVATGLARMERPTAGPLTSELARELAVRDGIKAIVTGQIDPVGSGFVLSASVVGADGTVLTAVRETASSDAGLIPALDRLSKALRERIGESLTTIRATVPLEQVTTGSVEALRRYSEAVRLAQGGAYAQAIPLLEEATRLDTSFAMAWRKLSVSVSNMHGSSDEAIAAATRAYRHRDRLPDLERDLTTALYHSVVDRDRTAEVASYRSALEIDPNNDVALNNLALALMKQRNFAAAESLLVRGTFVGRSDVQYGNAIMAQVAQGRFDDARTTMARFARAWPKDPNLGYARVTLAVASGQRDSAHAMLSRLVAEPLNEMFGRSQALAEMALLDVTEGRLQRGELEARQAMDGAEAGKTPDVYIDIALVQALVELRVRNDPAAALRRLDTALARHPLASMPAVDRPYSMVAWLYALAGRTRDAQRLLAEEDAAVPLAYRRSDAGQHAVAGALAAAAGRTADAIGEYRTYHDSSSCAVCGLFEMADLYARAGQRDSAIVVLQRFVSTPSAERTDEDASSLAAAYKRLGELYEAQGDRGEAVASYGRFTALWRNADPELQPVVRDVLARIAALSRER